MTDKCFRLDELDCVANMNPGDPRRQHLAECPLCRARLAAYRAFLTEAPPPSESSPERARAELESFIDKMVHGRVEAGQKPGFRSALLAVLSSRRVLAPGLAVAAALLLVVVLKPFRAGEDRSPASLRGGETPGVVVASIAVEDALIVADVVTFRWNALAEADRYEVEIFDTGLSEIARFDAGRGNTLEVATEDIPRVDGPLLWRVVAFHEGDTVARSQPTPIDLNRR
jgi:hypothetical protein